MFKKLLIVSSLSLLAACSSQSDENYGEDAVVSNNNNENTGNEIVGKAITPVNLLEENLSLTESELYVTVRSSDEAEKNKSTIEFSLEYTTVNSEDRNDDQAAISTYNVVVLNSDRIEDKLQALIIERKAEKEALDKDNKPKNKKKAKKEEVKTTEPIVEEITPETITLESSEGSQSCSDDECQVTQTISFDVDTQMLIDAQENGFVFLLKPKEGEAFLETMIPASYLQALLENVKSQSMSKNTMSDADQTNSELGQKSAEKEALTGESTSQ